ncbi:hypothetical protein B8281_03190 [Cellulosimicrobium sp. TH-20]|uniref:hypothetical protein n=1 Tax=Cellulosimicrobium sp. TH-20 TaxID=1980001 RepID=UPI000A17AF66|nr:hypothetical protein [Cellulosimicrobium sp. TH-20]ARK03885.1 hypothetical protein B8281_03190 [Cellulosimicrobium sp. TH-20]
MSDEGDTVDDQQVADWMLPLPVREGWAPVDEWLKPRTTFNEHGRRLLRDWLELFYPTRTQMTRGVERRRMSSSYFEAAQSIWRVAVLDTDENGRGCYGLRREVSPTADSAAHLAASGPRRRAGEHLRLAWAKLYGLHPDPSGAYWHAVKAIEAAGKSTLAPDDDDATLGKLMGNLRTGRSNFRVRLDGDEHNDSRDTLHHLMGMVWRSEFDRHGTDDPEVPLGVSGADAEPATFAAITLVLYFQAGHIWRVKADSNSA